MSSNTNHETYVLKAVQEDGTLDTVLEAATRTEFLEALESWYLNCYSNSFAEEIIYPLIVSVLQDDFDSVDDDTKTLIFDASDQSDDEFVDDTDSTDEEE